MKLAVLKPDHLGDLVLSSAAIRALAAAHPDLVLLVGSHNLELAGWLFPDLAVQPFDMRHLVRGSTSTAPCRDLVGFDAVAILRRDAVVTPRWAELRTRAYAMFQEDNDSHQTLLDYGVAREWSPAYDIDAMHFGERRAAVAQKSDRPSASVGLSIGSGFYTNLWPLVRWIELARKLMRQGREVFVISGPAEAAMASVLLHELGLEADRAISGGCDYAGFAARIDQLDLVVASDGGAAHLCALAAPVLSVFGSSPYRRYAPYGSWNRVLTQELSCSPCIQYDSRLVNGCLSVECMAAVTADDVVAALDVRLAPGEHASIRPGLTMMQGVSHEVQAEEIALREQEWAAWLG